MRTSVKTLFVLLVCLMAVGSAQGATITVPADYATIQAAVDAALPGDTVYVQAGEYTESVTLKDGVSLKGEGTGLVTLKPDTWYALHAEGIGGVSIEDLTLFDDRGYSRFPFEGSTGAYMNSAGVSFRNVLISGFNSGLYYTGTYSTSSLPVIEDSTITGNGSGIMLYSNAQAVVRNNTISDILGGGVTMYYSSHAEITGNTLSGSGYGTYAFRYCRPLVEDNVITANGTGMSHAWSSHSTILNNLITQNIGDGIYAVTSSSPTIRGNIISKNGSDGMWMFLNRPIVENNTIVENAESGVANSYYSNFVLRNNIIAYNGEWGVKTRKYFNNHYSMIRLYYNDVYGNGVGDIDPLAQVYTGNISADPLFVDEEAENYRLSAGSPCRDAGDPNPVYNDINGTRNDMGAYGGPFAMPLLENGFDKLLGKLKGKLLILPDDSFKNEKAHMKETFERKLDVVLKLVEKGVITDSEEEKIEFYSGALDKLTHDILPKCDGHFGGHPNNDWIVTYEAQSVVYPIVVDLITILQTELNALN